MEISTLRAWNHLRNQLLLFHLMKCKCKGLEGPWSCPWGVHVITAHRAHSEEASL